MRKLFLATLVVGILSSWVCSTMAQPPGRPRPPQGRDRGRGDMPPPPPPNPLVEALDKDHDGTISSEELAGAVESLKKLDKNGDGKLTEDELRPTGPPRRPPNDGPPESGRGPGGPDGPRGDRRPPGRPPMPPDGGPGAGGPGAGGPRVLPPFAREQLQLTDEQNKQIEALEADVRLKLHNILTPEQLAKMAEMHRRGPQGPPGDGPPPSRRPGRPGGPPDDEEDDEPVDVRDRE